MYGRVALVPIENETPVEAFLNRVAIDDDRLSRRSVDGRTVDGQQLPAGGRQTIHRRVDGVALALRFVIADVHVRRVGGLLDVVARDVVVGSQHLDGSRIEILLARGN